MLGGRAPDLRPIKSGQSNPFSKLLFLSQVFVFFSGVENESDPSNRLPLLAGILFGFLVIFHLALAFQGKFLFRATHLGTALEYGRHGVDLWHPIMVGFNANGTPTAEELPIWQAIVGRILHALGSQWFGWANIVSLLLFTAGLWPFFQLARAYTGDRVAWWATIFFLAQPLIFLSAGFGSTDGFCLTLTLWFLFFADKIVRTGKAIWWAPAVLFACLGAVSKAPFFMAAGLCSVGLLLLNRIRDWRRWVMLASSALVALAAFELWTVHTDHFAAQAEYPYYELRLSHSPQIVYWYFGNLHTRLDAALWVKAGWRFLHATVGALPLTALLLAGLASRGNPMAKVWLAATLLTTLVFTHVVLVHWHYYLMCCPAVALLCGSVLARCDSIWAVHTPRACLRLSLLGVVLGLSTIDGAITTKFSIFLDSYPASMANLIRKHTQPSDKLILYGGFWGGEELFRAGRNGFYVYFLSDPKDVPTMRGLFDLLTSDKDLARLKELGYNKLVLMSESPVRFAAEAGNPASQRKRYFYPERLPEKVEAWPTIYRDPDLLIKQIP